MTNVKNGGAWRISVWATLASLLVLLACSLPKELNAADLGGNLTRLVGDLSGVAYNLHPPLQIGLLCLGSTSTVSRPVASNLEAEDKSFSSFPVVRLPINMTESALAGGQLEAFRMQRDQDGQQGTAKPAPKTTQKPMPPSGTQKQQSNRNMRSGMRIPEHQFRSKFGRQHTFQIQQLNGNRFQAGGFVFEVVDVWPAVFSFGDPFFVDEFDEQFFLFDADHPGVRTLVIIVQEL